MKTEKPWQRKRRKRVEARLRAGWPNNGVSPFYGDPGCLEYAAPARRERNKDRGVARRGSVT